MMVKVVLMMIGRHVLLLHLSALDILLQKSCNAAARQASCTVGANGTYCSDSLMLMFKCCFIALGRTGCDYVSCLANCGIAFNLY